MSNPMVSVRGLRNKNPGNLRRTKDKWKGLSPEQTDPSFFRFESMVMGIRALTMILLIYRNGYNLVTVRGIVNRWAPPVENNTDAYVNSVAKRMSVAPDAKIDTTNPEVMFALVRGIIRHEVGAVAALLISDDTVRSGIVMAGDLFSVPSPKRPPT